MSGLLDEAIARERASLLAAIDAVLPLAEAAHDAVIALKGVCGSTDIAAANRRFVILQKAAIALRGGDPDDVRTPSIAFVRHPMAQLSGEIDAHDVSVDLSRALQSLRASVTGETRACPAPGKGSAT